MRKLTCIMVLLILILTGCTKLGTYILIDDTLVECTILQYGTVSYLVQYEYDGRIITNSVWQSEVFSIDPSKVNK